MKTLLALAAAAMIAAPAVGLADTSLGRDSVLGRAAAPPADTAGDAAYYGRGLVAPPSAQAALPAPGEDELVVASATLKSCNRWAWDYRKWRLVRAC